MSEKEKTRMIWAAQQTCRKRFTAGASKHGL